MSGFWEEYNTGRDVTSAFVTFSENDEATTAYWITQIQNLGWNVGNIDLDSDGYYTVNADYPATGESTKTEDKDPERALRFLYDRITRSLATRTASAPEEYQVKFASWDKYFVDDIESIAHEYADAKIYDKKAASAWMELALDNKRRAEQIGNQIDVEVTDHPLPYKSFNDMVDDVINKKKFIVSRANARHPIWNVDQVVNFRIVHDILGHVAAGADWSWFGMNKAFSAHAPLLSAPSQKALFVEILGKGAFNAYYRSMAQDKIAFLKSFDEKQEIENRPGHRETHPSQSLVPTKLPKIDKSSNLDDGIMDPNYGLKTNVTPLDNNAFLWHKILDADNGLIDPLNSPKLKDIAHEIDPRWHQHSNDAYLQQAVANAFKASLTGENPQHYQAINHIPAGVTDSLEYWDAINTDKNAHNLARGYSEAGREFDPFMPFLMQLIKRTNPHLEGEDLHKQARQALFNMLAEEEEQSIQKVGPEANSRVVADDAKKRLLKRLKFLTKANTSENHDFGSDEMFIESSTSMNSELYPSPLASAIKPLAEIAKHIDELTDGAKTDLMQGGAGHHFRGLVLKKNIEGLNPDKISEAWFYLAPQSSQLGILTPSIIKALGEKPDEIQPRDYFKLERQLQAGRDASGYNHMNLGLFSHGFHNVLHYDNGHHPSKSHLHVTKPESHHHKDWENETQPFSKPNIPSWWNDTKSIRKQIGKDWDKSIGVNHPRSVIPYKQADAAFTPLIMMPYFTDPNTQQTTNGQPGQTAMQHMLESLALGSPMDVWNSKMDVGKEVSTSDQIH